MATSGIDSTTTAAILTAAHGGTAITFATPIKLLFCSAMRTADNLTDTEWIAGGGYTPGTGFSGLTFAASAAGAPSTQSTNIAATLTNIQNNTTWAGCKETDSSGTIKTLFWATLTTPKTVNAGDTVTVPSGSLTDSLG